MKTTLQYKDMSILGKEFDPKHATIDWDFNMVKFKSNIEFEYVINKILIVFESGQVDVLDKAIGKVYFNGSLEQAMIDGLSPDHLIIDYAEDEPEVTLYIGKLDS